MSACTIESFRSDQRPVHMCKNVRLMFCVQIENNFMEYLVHNTAMHSRRHGQPSGQTKSLRQLAGDNVLNLPLQPMVCIVIKGCFLLPVRMLAF